MPNIADILHSIKVEARKLETKPLTTETAGTVEEQIATRQAEIPGDQQRLGKQRVDTAAAIGEHTPELYQYAPGSPEAQSYLKLLNKQRDLVRKANDIKTEESLLRIVEEDRLAGRSVKDTIKDIISSTRGAGRKYVNIEARAEQIANRINSTMHDLRDSLRTKTFGLTQDTELGEEMVRYLKDGKVKNQALEAQVIKIADQWNKASEALRTMRNKAGAQIGKMQDWVIPQSHDAYKIRQGGLEEWKNFIKPKLDKARIEAEQGTDLDTVLDSAYKNIVGRKLEASPKGATSVLAKKQEYERVLHFKTGDDIIEYGKKYGNEDIFSTIESHVRTQANEIAQLQTLGSNPEAMYEKLKQIARNDGMGSISEGSLDRLWRAVTGQADATDVISKADQVLANVSATHRALQVGSKLGGAVISSIADLANIVLGSGYRNLNSIKIFSRGIGTMLQEAVTIGKSGYNTTLASRLALVSEYANAAITNNRYSEMGAGWAQRRAENVIRASGLAAWTNALKTSFALELSGKFADYFGKRFDDIPFKKMLEEYGITADDWKKISKSKTYDSKGSNLMDLNEVFKVDEAIGEKVAHLLENEMNSMIATPSARTRAITTWGAAKGTLAGETARNMMLFKSFPITIMMIHLNRMGMMSKQGAVGYASAMMVSSVVFGSVTLWMKDIAGGRTPRDWKRPAMIPEAIAQSGGLGLFGDYLLGQDTTSYGHHWTTTLAGVGSTTLEDIGKTAIGDVISVAKGDMSMQKYAANAYNRAKNYIPGQNLWYTKLLIEKTIGDKVNKIIDPDFVRKQRKRNKTLRFRGQEPLFK